MDVNAVLLVKDHNENKIQASKSLDGVPICDL